MGVIGAGRGADSRIEENVEGGVKKFLLKTYKKFNKEDYEQAIDQVVDHLGRVLDAQEDVGHLVLDLHRLLVAGAVLLGQLDELLVQRGEFLEALVDDLRIGAAGSLILFFLVVVIVLGLTPDVFGGRLPLAGKWLAAVMVAASPP